MALTTLRNDVMALITSLGPHTLPTACLKPLIAVPYSLLSSCEKNARVRAMDAWHGLESKGSLALCLARTYICSENGSLAMR